MVKNPPAYAGDARDVRRIPWRRKWQLTIIFLPRKPHEWRRLLGYGPWGAESDMTEHARTMWRACRQLPTPASVSTLYNNPLRCVLLSSFSS